MYRRSNLFQELVVAKEFKAATKMMRTLGWNGNGTSISGSTRSPVLDNMICLGQQFSCLYGIPGMMSAAPFMSV